MTNQDVFNNVWKYFVIDENPKSTDKSGCCAYRGENGTKCAIGCLFPDDLYRKEMDDPIDDTTVDTIIDRFPHITTYTGHDVGFLSSIQLCHDNSNKNNFTTHIAERLTALAYGYGLLIPGENNA